MALNYSNRQQNNSRENLFAAPAHFENLFFNGNFAPDDDYDRQEANDAAAIAFRVNNNDNAIINHNNNNNNNNNNYNNNNNEPACWIFGYGSLCWFPGFEYTKCITGYIRGYVRRFWQGNTTHRGTAEKPGRVATLVEEKEGITWGCAYKVTGNTAIEYLQQRECTLGGYATFETKFFPRVASYNTPFSGEAIKVIVYVATPDNCHWLGNDDSENIAEQIVTCSGPSGHNIEYLIRLAMFMHEEIPDAIDEHLFELEFLVMQLVHKRNISLWSVMGINPQRIRRDSHENIRRPLSFEFTSRVPDRKLRCLNI